ncbi:MAG: alanine--glyoxylate aminotransferase family protein [Chloroflexi bacterium]|nr:alanine--glyoxylate aminotransferase family protein [Chloroflexota bacterium]MCY3697547.1 alanine--glyoxylate aminotransferase family protein [Chloroflexota bacterium]
MSTNLRIPGPTPCPPEVLAAASGEMINHRGPEFAELLERLTSGIRPFFGTEQEIMIISASGTGAMEAAIVNTLSPGDNVLCITVGSFGDRFGTIAERYGAVVTRSAIEWGEAATPELVAGLVQRDDYDALLITHNETSTGVTNPIGEIAAAVREVADPLIIVDAVSSLGSIEMRMDDWGLDAVVTASQKGWLSPPGIAMAALSERGWQAAERSTMPSFYFDLTTHHDYAERGQPPWTPALPTMYAMDAALPMLIDEGPEAIYARHHRFASWTRSAAKSLGLELLADEQYASDTVTAVKVPNGMSGPAVTKRLREQHDVVIAGGQGKLAPSIWRIGHLGYLDESEFAACFSALQQALVAEGFSPAEGAIIPGIDG